MKISSIIILICLSFIIASSCKSTSKEELDHKSLEHLHTLNFSEQNEYLIALGYEFQGLNSIFVSGEADPDSPLWKKFNNDNRSDWESVYKQKFDNVVWHYSFDNKNNTLNRLQTSLENDNYIKESIPEVDGIFHMYNKANGKYYLTIRESILPKGKSGTLRVLMNND